MMQSVLYQHHFINQNKEFMKNIGLIWKILKIQCSNYDVCLLYLDLIAVANIQNDNKYF